MMRSVVLGGSSVRWDQRGIVRPCAGCVCGFGVWGGGESDCACELHWGKGDEDMQEAKTTSTWQPAQDAQPMAFGEAQVGSMMVLTSEMVLAGKPLFSACSRIVSSSLAS